MILWNGGLLVFIVTKIIKGRKYYYGWDRMYIWRLNRNDAKRYDTRAEAQAIASLKDAEVEYA